MILIGFIFYRHTKRARLSGNYKAFDIQNGSEIPWGNVKILFAPLAIDKAVVPVKVRLNHEDISLEGRGLIVNGQYLIGHYSETGKPERRRCGSFFFELDGSGNQWDGDYSFVDPKTKLPKSGKAKWIRS